MRRGAIATGAKWDREGRGAAGDSGAGAEGMFGLLVRLGAAPCAYDFVESAIVGARGVRRSTVGGLHEVVRFFVGFESAAVEFG